MTNITTFAVRNLGRLAVLSSLPLVALVCAGCAGGHASPPDDNVARAAVEGSLKAWQSGGKPGTIPGTDPPVQVFDTPWSQGQRLGSFEILGAENGPVEKVFKVRLSLQKPERVEEAEYHVLGQGPVMVFRDEDYQRNINMENGPPLTKQKGRMNGRRR
jgi:hypothetical protein